MGVVLTKTYSIKMRHLESPPLLQISEIIPIRSSKLCSNLLKTRLSIGHFHTFLKSFLCNPIEILVIKLKYIECVSEKCLNCSLQHEKVVLFFRHTEQLMFVRQSSEYVGRK